MIGIWPFDKSVSTSSGSLFVSIFGAWRMLAKNKCMYQNEIDRSGCFFSSCFFGLFKTMWFLFCSSGFAGWFWLRFQTNQLLNVGYKSFVVLWVFFLNSPFPLRVLQTVALIKFLCRYRLRINVSGEELWINGQYREALALEQNMYLCDDFFF